MNYEVVTSLFEFERFFPKVNISCCFHQQKFSNFSKVNISSCLSAASKKKKNSSCLVEIVVLDEIIMSFDNNNPINLC